MFSVLTPFSRTNIRYCFQHIPTFPVLIPSSFLKKEQWLKWKTPHDHHQSSIASIYFHYWLFSCGNPDIITTPFAIYPPDRKAWTLASLSQLHTINHVIKYGPNASPPQPLHANKNRTPYTSMWASKAEEKGCLTVLLRPNVDVEALQQHRSPSASPPDNSYESFALSNRHKTYRDRFRLLHKQLVLLFFLRGPPSL